MKRKVNLLFVMLIVAITALLLSSCGDNKKSNDSVCGDTLIEGDEVCDLQNLNLAQCETLGFGAGTLACSANCLSFDTSGCGASLTCGNNIKDGSDVCDGDDMGIETCQSQGFGPGNLKCMDNCAGFDYSECGTSLTCGNNTIDANELCDGSEVNGRTCVHEGFEQGTLKCSADCLSYDTSDCFTPCTAECGERECGPDPICGESCGECSDEWDVCNSMGKCEKSCDFEPVESDAVLNINLETFTLSGTLTLNSATMPDNTQEYYEQESRGGLTFRNKDSGDSTYVSIDAAGSASFIVELFKGSYDVTFSPNDDDYQNVLPELNVVLENDVVVDSQLTKNFNLETVQVSGKITLDNAVMPNNTQEYYEQESRGGLTFRNSESGDSKYVSINASGAAAYIIKLFKGSYDISFSPNDDDYQNVLPELNVILEKNVTFNSDMAKSYDLETATITGTVTLDGAVMPNNTQEYYEQESRGGITFTNRESGDSKYVSINASGAASYSMKLFKGSYDLSFSPNDDDYQNVLPELNMILDSEVDVSSVTAKNYNLETSTISGTVTLNGGMMPNNTMEYYEQESRGGITFKNRESGDSKYVSINASGAASYSIKLYKGTYDLSFSPNDDDYQDVLPEMNVILDTKVDVSSVTTKDYDLETAAVTGTVTLNGGMMPNNTMEYYEQESRGGITFRNRESGDSKYVSINASGAASFSVEVFKGSYDLSFSPNNDDYQNVLPELNMILENNLSVASVTNRDYNLATATVTGTVTLNGGVMPNNTMEYYEQESRGGLVFRNKESSDTQYVTLNASGAATFSILLFKGSYDVSLSPNNDDYQNVLPDMSIKLVKGCFDYSASCDKDKDDISGTWEFVADGPSWQPTTFYLVQNGDTITGTFDAYNTSGNINPGTRTGDSIKFEFKPYYDMIVEGNIMSGCFILGRFDTIGHSGIYYDSDFVGTKIE